MEFWSLIIVFRPIKIYTNLVVSMLGTIGEMNILMNLDYPKLKVGGMYLQTIFFFYCPTMPNDFICALLHLVEAHGYSHKSYQFSMDCSMKYADNSLVLGLMLSSVS